MTNSLSAPIVPELANRTSEHLADDVRRIHELFAQAPGCMLVFVGPEHVVHMANPAYLAFTGLTPEIIGKPARQALRRGSARGFDRLLDEVYRSGQPRVLRNVMLQVNRCPGGPDEEAYADFVLQPLRDPDGSVYGIFCQGHEVTNEKLAADELRASREQLKAALQDAPAPERPVQAPMFQRHVLLVEDDDLVRDQVQRQLIALGCRVTAHRNGHDALQRLDATGDVDLLMTDIVMPGGMNGRQLADYARRLKPNLRVLFTSGHTEEPMLTALRTDSRAGFLAKPYRRAELARTLAEVLQDAA